MNQQKNITSKKNTVQETLIIPLFARKICSEKFPDSVLVIFPAASAIAAWVCSLF